MSYSLAQRTFKHNVLFASAACVMALTLTAGPVFADTPLDRVEVSGRVVEAPARSDVRASCTRVDAQLQKQLLPTWFRGREPGQVDVRFVVADGHVEAAKARGMSPRVVHDVQRAVRRLDCASAPAGTGIYRLRVVFADPATQPGDAVASAADSTPYRVAIAATR